MKLWTDDRRDGLRGQSQRGKAGEGARVTELGCLLLLLNRMPCAVDADGLAALGAANDNVQQTAARTAEVGHIPGGNDGPERKGNEQQMAQPPA